MGGITSHVFDAVLEPINVFILDSSSCAEQVDIKGIISVRELRKEIALTATKVQTKRPQNPKLGVPNCPGHCCELTFSL